MLYHQCLGVFQTSAGICQPCETRQTNSRLVKSSGEKNSVNFYCGEEDELYNQVYRGVYHQGTG